MPSASAPGSWHYSLHLVLPRGYRRYHNSTWRILPDDFRLVQGRS